MKRGAGRRGLRALVLASLPLFATVPAGAETGLRLELDIGSLVHEAFDARGLRAHLSWVGPEPRFEVQADRLHLPEPVGRVEALHLRCPRAEVTARRLACPDARLTARGDGWRLDAAALDFDWDREAGLVRFSVPWPGLFRGRGRVSGLAGAPGLRVDLDLAGLDLPMLLGSGLVPLELPVAVQAGTAGVAGRIDTRGRVPAAQLDLSVSGLDFSDPAGLHAAEGLSASGRVAHGPAGYEVQARFTEGAAFFDPWFLDLAEAGPVSVSISSLQTVPGVADGVGWSAASGEMTLGGHTRLQGTGLQHRGDRLEQGEIEWQTGRLDLAGGLLAEPMLAGTVLGRSRFEGETHGRLSVSQGRVRAVEASWQGLGLNDDLGRFALRDSAGRIAWSDDALAPESHLTVAAGEVLGLPAGPFQMHFQLEPRGLRLLEPLFVPVLDGGAGADHFHLRVGPEGPEVEFEGGIRALSLERLTEALGWPRFTGRLAGIIPRVFYDVDGLRVDGLLLVQVFDGEIVLSGLRIRNLFGIAPELEVSAEVRRLELDLLTSALDVGRVEGRLSGRVEDLLLVDWVPQRMRLSLATPEEDPGRRRISQRAVENLTAVGGGVQGRLAATFLRVFDAFAYRRLGFNCELEGDVCLVSGVVDHPDGTFTLVEGGGLPQIEVIGHNRRVDWPELVRRLDAVREGPPPVVQ
ncbi:MAG: hypothetical protein EA347_08985 [Thioalkalivibrio sp.]|nr:MAG: hypothetical protein EA347_08985 [Thioalkalivibrio sp.]